MSRNFMGGFPWGIWMAAATDQDRQLDRIRYISDTEEKRPQRVSDEDHDAYFRTLVARHLRVRLPTDPFSLDEFEHRLQADAAA